MFSGSHLVVSLAPQNPVVLPASVLQKLLREMMVAYQKDRALFKEKAPGLCKLKMLEVRIYLCVY